MLHQGLEDEFIEEPDVEQKAVSDLIRAAGIGKQGDDGSNKGVMHQRCRLPGVALTTGC